MADDRETHELHAETMKAVLRQIKETVAEVPGENTRALAEAYERIASNRPKR